MGHSCAVTGQFNQVSATGIGYGYKVLNKLRCLQKRKKKSESSGGNLTGFSPDEQLSESKETEEEEGQG